MGDAVYIFANGRSDLSNVSTLIFSYSRKSAATSLKSATLLNSAELTVSTFCKQQLAMKVATGL